jgi:hypothetical protein
MFSWQYQHRRTSDPARRTIANWSLWQRTQLAMVGWRRRTSGDAGLP